MLQNSAHSTDRLREFHVGGPPSTEELVELAEANLYVAKSIVHRFLWDTALDPRGSRRGVALDVLDEAGVAGGREPAVPDRRVAMVCR